MKEDVKMTSTKYFDVKILLWVFIGIPLIASTNIDCGGKSFHCLNSTHFMICVDLGGGMSTTVDDLVIPCPPPTLCSLNNRFECEFPQSVASSTTVASSTISPAIPTTLTSATNEFESAATLPWEEIAVSTTIPHNTSVGHLEIQNYTTVSITESILIEVTTSADVIYNSQNETLKEIIPIPNTTIEPRVTMIEDILITDTNFLNVTESVVDVSINETTATEFINSSVTEANKISDVTENNVNETSAIPEVEIFNTVTTEANTVTYNMTDNNIIEVTTNSQMEVITSISISSNSITSNVSESNIVINVYETFTEINTGISDTNEVNWNGNDTTSSFIYNTTMDTSATPEGPMITSESGGATSKAIEIFTDVSMAPELTEIAGKINTISTTTTEPKIIVNNETSGLIAESATTNEIIIFPIEVTRKTKTQEIYPITTALPEEIGNTDISATLNSVTLIDEAVSTSTLINTDFTTTASIDTNMDGVISTLPDIVISTSHPSVPDNQAFITEDNSYVTPETSVQETTILIPLPETVSNTISNANTLVEDIETSTTTSIENTESNVQKTKSTILEATEVVSEKNVTTMVPNVNVETEVNESIKTTNITKTITAPDGTQNIDVVILDSTNKLNEQILVPTTVQSMKTESNVKASTGFINTIATVTPDMVSNAEFNSNALVDDILLSTTVPSVKKNSNVTEITVVINTTTTTTAPAIVSNTDATFNSSTLLEELTSSTMSNVDIINVSALINANNVSVISPNLITTVNIGLTESTKTNNELTSPSIVAEVINDVTTEYNIKENTEPFNITRINNFSPVFDINADGNSSITMETRKSIVLSANSTTTTSSDNNIKSQTRTTEMDIIKLTTGLPREISTEYPSTVSELFDSQTTITILNGEITTENINALYSATNKDTTSINATVLNKTSALTITNETLQEENFAVNKVGSGGSTGGRSILDMDISPLNTTDATINESATTEEIGLLRSSISSGTESSDITSTAENNQVHISTTKNIVNQLSLETTTPNILPTEVATEKYFDITSVVTALDKRNVTSTADYATNSAINTNILHTNNINNEIPVDAITTIMEVKDTMAAVSVTVYLTTDSPSTEHPLRNDSGVVIVKENTNTTPTSNHLDIMISPKTSVVPENVGVTPTTQNSKVSDDNTVPEDITISTALHSNNSAIHSQMFNVSTSVSTLEIMAHVQTETAPTNTDLIKTDTHIISTIPSTERNVYSTNNDTRKIVSAGNVDVTFATSANLKNNNLTAVAKIQNDLLNTTTIIAEAVKINTDTENTVTSSAMRPQTEGLLTQKNISNEYERNSSVHLPENDVTNQPANTTLTQPMIDNSSVHVNPSMGSVSVQGTNNSGNSQSGTTEIEPKNTNVPVYYLTNNEFITAKPEGSATHTAIRDIFRSTVVPSAINVVSFNRDAIGLDNASSVVSAGSNTDNNFMSINTKTVQEGIFINTRRSNNTIAPETVPVTKYENKGGILFAIKSPDGGNQINNHTNLLQNVLFNTSVESADLHLTTSTLESIPSMKVFLPHNPDAIIYGKPSSVVSVRTNSDSNSSSTNTVWETAAVQESISSDIRKPNDKAFKVIPLPQYENKINVSPDVANESTAPTDSASHINKFTTPLKNVVFNAQNETANDHAMSESVTTSSRPAGNPTTTATEKNSSFVIQSTGSFHVTEGFYTSQTENNLPGSTSSMQVSFTSTVETLSPTPNIMDLGAIHLREEESTTRNGVLINHSRINFNTLTDTEISKSPVLISETAHITDIVEKEDSNVVKNSKLHSHQDSGKHNINNIGDSVQSTSNLSITTTKVYNTKSNNSSVEFHTESTNTNAQPSIERKLDLLPNSLRTKSTSFNDDTNLPNIGKTDTSVVVTNEDKVNKYHNVNIELAINQNSSRAETATIAPMPLTRDIATTANVRETSTVFSSIGSTRPVATTEQLSILTTVDVDVEPINVDRKNNFDCYNHMRGKYADKIDCRKFYICIGMRQPIKGLCPVNTVFSEIKKQCTKNLSHCIRENNFKCVTNGRFSDIFQYNVYYICVKNRQEFVRFKFQCQSGYKLHKTTVRCVHDVTEPPNQSTSYDSDASVEMKSSENSSFLNRDVSKTSDSSYSRNENVRGNVSKSEKNKLNSERKNGKKSKEKSKSKEDFECEEVGKFPDPKSCRRYYVCSKSNRSDEYRQRRKRCDSDEVFHKDKKKCVDADSFECP